MPSEDPLREMLPPATDEQPERPKYQPSQRSRLSRRLKIFFAIIVLALLSIPVLLANGVRISPFTDDLLLDIDLVNSHGGAALTQYSGRVRKEEARQTAQFLITNEAFGGPDGAYVLLDRKEGSVVITFSVKVADNPLNRHFKAQQQENKNTLDMLQEYLTPIRDRLSQEVFNGEDVVVELAKVQVVDGRRGSKAVYRQILRRF